MLGLYWGSCCWETPIYLRAAYTEPLHQLHACLCQGTLCGCILLKALHGAMPTRSLTTASVEGSIVTPKGQPAQTERVPLGTMRGYQGPSRDF